MRQMTEPSWLPHSPAPHTWLVAHSWVHEEGSTFTSIAKYNAEFCSNSGTDSAEIPLPWWLPLTWEMRNTVILTHWSAASWEIAACITPITQPRLLSWPQGWVCTKRVVWGSWSRQSRSREADSQNRQPQVGAKPKGGLIQFTAPRKQRPPSQQPSFSKVSSRCQQTPSPLPGMSLVLPAMWVLKRC